MHRLTCSLAVVALLAGPFLAPPPAAAQTVSSDVLLTLVSQPAWSGPARPLEVRVRAVNRGPDPLVDLSLVLTIEAPARSRSAYELSLRTRATSSLFAYTFFQEGQLASGATRTFTVRQPLPTYLRERGDNGLYPLQVDLLSAYVPVAGLRTPMIFLIEHPQVPLNLSWTWELGAPVEHGPGETFLPGALQYEIDGGGRVATTARLLEELGGVAVTVAISPVLVEQLSAMADGYEVVEPGGDVREIRAGTGGASDAAQVLEDLRSVVGRPVTEVVAMPYGDPSVPALFEAGLGRDLPVLIEEGREQIEATLGARPSTSVFRPPGSNLDPGTLSWLADRGASVLLVDPGFLPTDEAFTFTPPSVVRLSGAGASAAVPLPDARVASRLEAYPDDPVLAAHAALGELASIWFEFPGTPGRGANLLFGQDAGYGPEVLEALAPLLASAPWLRPVTAARFTETIDPQDQRSLGARTYPELDDGYVAQILQARARLERFEGTLVEPDPAIAGYQRDLLLVIGSTFVDRPDLGRAFIDHITDAIQSVYTEVAVLERPVTLTSRSGTIPVTVENRSPHALRVQLRLVADRRLDFVQGSSKEVELLPDTQTFFFDVRAQTTGRFPIKVQLHTVSPDPDLIAEAQVLVRSTAYNRVALFLTIGAAVFLLGWWGRRLLPRRAS